MQPKAAPIVEIPPVIPIYSAAMPTTPGINTAPTVAHAMHVPVATVEEPQAELMVESVVGNIPDIPSPTASSPMMTSTKLSAVIISTKEQI